VAPLVVDRLELIDVHYRQRQRSIACNGFFQFGEEEPAVGQSGECICMGEAAGTALAPGELLERLTQLTSSRAAVLHLDRGGQRGEQSGREIELQRLETPGRVTHHGCDRPCANRQPPDRSREENDDREQGADPADLECCHYHGEERQEEEWTGRL